jgi:hypothetical protein
MYELQKYYMPCRDYLLVMYETQSGINIRYALTYNTNGLCSSLIYKNNMGDMFIIDNYTGEKRCC